MDTEICRFCEIEKGNIKEAFDHPIKENSNYFSLASVGAFIPGWSLIVPRKHTYSLREMYRNPDFLKFVHDWIMYINKIVEKKIIVFEHGANRCGSQTSCGTNHAHLHVVPYSGSLIGKMLADREWVSVKYDQIENIVKNNEYLLYAEVANQLEDSDIYLHILQKEESQYFRRLLAEEMEVTDYNYKLSPYRSNTIYSYQKLVGVENE